MNNELLDFLHREGAFAHYWTPNTNEFYIDKETGEQRERKHSFWFPVEKRLPVPAAWEGRNTYFCVHPMRAIPEKLNKKGNPVPQRYIKAQIGYLAAINCFFAEFDVKDYGTKDAIFAHLDTLPIYPSVIVDSGGGLHCYWLLEHTCPIII